MEEEQADDELEEFPLELGGVVFVATTTIIPPLVLVLLFVWLPPRSTTLPPCRSTCRTPVVLSLPAGSSCSIRCRLITGCSCEFRSPPLPTVQHVAEIDEDVGIPPLLPETTAPFSGEATVGFVNDDSIDEVDGEDLGISLPVSIMLLLLRLLLVLLSTMSSPSPPVLSGARPPVDDSCPF